MQNIDPLKILTYEEVKSFFSACEEYEVENMNGCIKIKLKCIDNIECCTDGKQVYTYYYISLAVFEPTFQTLIRTITKLAHNHYAGILKKEQDAKEPEMG